MRVRTACVLVFVVVAVATGQQAKPASAASSTAADVLAFEKTMEAAVVRGDVAFLEGVCASDFSFTHGDGWTTGGQPLRVENKAQWLASVSKAPYLSRDLDSVQVEMHGDIAITYGQYRARNKSAARDRGAFTVWFERVYAFRNGRWQYVSHRTVHGPTYEDKGPAGR
jgi:ketosteroid isomerase-like protein